MEIDVIDTLDLEPRGEVEVVVRDLSAAQDVDLGLGVDGWSVREAVDGHSVFGEEDGIGAMCEASCFLFGVEALYCQLYCQERVAGLRYRTKLSVDTAAAVSTFEAAP
jgi:hypothetical protein